MKIARSLYPFGFLFLISLLTGCIDSKPWYSDRYDRHQIEQPGPVATDPAVDYTLWMIGDCGKSPADKPWPTFELLKQQLGEAPQNSAVIYLGDNIYELGLPADTAPDRKEMERRMTAQLAPTLGYPGQVIVIPGNHDWAQGKEDGYAARLREEAFVEQHLQRGNTYLPDQGCPGPYELALGDSIVLLAYDSQWWLHKHKKPGKAEGCSAETDADFLADFDAALARHAGKQILIAAHHPFYSYGPHGGHYHPLCHLFPLLMLNSKLWVPLPVLGTLAVAYRKFHGNIQDIPHPRYRAMRDALEDKFEKIPDLIYISGHDHNLQYLPKDSRHYIVSGTGSKGNYVSHGRKALFTDAERGFGKLTFLQDGSRILEFYVIDRKGTASCTFSQTW
jgi:Calcineurin-like phosphoesterase